MGDDNEQREYPLAPGVHIYVRWVKVEDIGDTEFLPEEVLDKFKFRAENQKVIEAGRRPAQGKAMLLGITQASLSTDSFHLLPGDNARTSIRPL